MWKFCGKCGKCKGIRLYTCGYMRPGARLSRSCKGAGSCDFVKELGPAAVKELRFTGAAISSCARICQGAGNGAGKIFLYFYFSPFIIAHFVTFVKELRAAPWWNICSIFSKKKKPQELASPWGCGILWPSPHGLGHFIWSP